MIATARRHTTWVSGVVCEKYCKCYSRVLYCMPTRSGGKQQVSAGSRQGPAWRVGGRTALELRICRFRFKRAGKRTQGGAQEKVEPPAASARIARNIWAQPAIQPVLTLADVLVVHGALGSVGIGERMETMIHSSSPRMEQLQLNLSLNVTWTRRRPSPA